MKDLYKVVNFEDLKEGQPVYGFVKYVLKWDYETDGKPSYAVVPNEDEGEE
jgi:hypothetical protein